MEWPIRGIFAVCKMVWGGWQFAALQIICKFRGKIFCKLAFWLTVDCAMPTGGKNIRMGAGTKGMVIMVDGKDG